MSSETWRRRRQRVLNRLGDGVLVLPTAPLRIRNGDVYHAFRPDSDFYYLTGVEEPEAVLVAVRESARSHRAVLFVRERDREREVWDGPRLGPARAKGRYDVDAAHPTSELYARLEPLVDGAATVHYTLGRDDEMDRALARIFERNRVRHHRRNDPAHPAMNDPRPAIAEERLVKDAEEVAALENAAAITAAGHREAMRAAAPRMMEYELQAEIEGAFRRLGSTRNGYESIVASGTNACILHYVSNDRRMKAGDLVLVDAGAEHDQYTADITRTFPVSGEFTRAQKDVYRIVLRAQKAAIRAVKPGRPWGAPHAAAVRVVLDGLVQLGVLRGKRSALGKKAAHRPWFMHGTSHWLGLDVHDVGGYEDGEGEPTKLRAGMVLTIEPGLYFGPRDERVPKAYRGIGIRIEDDVLVTRTGHRVLTDDVPKEIRDVEALCQR